jgi:hypothetical protein
MPSRCQGRLARWRVPEPKGRTEVAQIEESDPVAHVQ